MQATSVPVLITGTPMTFHVPRRLVYPTTTLQEKECYVPKKPVHHPSLGVLFCEDIELGLDGEPDRVVCSAARGVCLDTN